MNDSFEPFSMSLILGILNAWVSDLKKLVTKRLLDLQVLY